MASDGGADKRHPYGPRAIGSLLPGITRPTFRKRSPAAAQIMADWADIVGPALAAVTAPRRLQAGTLTLACSGAIALELQHLAAQLTERINVHVGRIVVERLRFTQDFQAATRDGPPPGPGALEPVDVPGMPPGPLRDALGALGAVVGRGRNRDPA